MLCFLTIMVVPYNQLLVAIVIFVMGYVVFGSGFFIRVMMRDASIFGSYRQVVNRCGTHYAIMEPALYFALTLIVLFIGYL